MLGVVLGWGLNQLSHYLQNKPELAFIIDFNKEAEGEAWQRVKTSPSEYMIEIINVGKVPVILEEICLYHEGHLLVDCFLDDDQRKILPNRSKYYKMMEQEKSALQSHCNKYLFSKCEVIAYCVNGTKINGSLDVNDFYGRALMNNNLIGRNNAVK